MSEKLGTFAAALTGDPIRKVEITYAGKLSELQVAPLTRSVLKGLLSYRHGAEVNFVNAPFLAEQHRMLVEETKSSRHDVYANLLQVRVVTEVGSHLVAGTLIANIGPRLVQIGNFAVDLEPRGTLLLTEHHDQPGMIGQVGTLLGKADINIAAMQVGRQEAGGSALMVLAVDKTPDDATMQALAQVSGIYSVRDVTL